MRTERTEKELEKVSNDITDIARIIRSIVKQMRVEGKESISIHSKTQIDHHIPMLLQWAYKIEGDSKLQLRGETDDHHQTKGDAIESNRLKNITRLKK